MSRSPTGLKTTTVVVLSFLNVSGFFNGNVFRVSEFVLGYNGVLSGSCVCACVRVCVCIGNGDERADSGAG